MTAGLPSSLPGAADFAGQIRECPLRWVLTDEVVRHCTAFAFAEGARLAGCLDLLRVPAERLWIEWLDAPRVQILEAVPGLGAPQDFAHDCQRAGVLLASEPGGRHGHFRLFWNSREAPGHPMLSPLVAHFQLDRPFPAPQGLPHPLAGGPIRLQDPSDPSLDALLQHVQLFFDAAWASHYRAACRNAADATQLVRQSTAGIASDIPMLLALLLFATAREGLPQTPVSLARLNRARRALSRPPLLDHVEVRLPLLAGQDHHVDTSGTPRGPHRRLHHVRGHLVRRGRTVFWRVPHLRGSAALGRVRSRTVTLTF